MRIPLLLQKDGHHLINSSHGSTVWLKVPSNECEECLTQWRFGRTGLHVSTTRVSGSREEASCLQT
jgi:hypothetical protein